MTPTVLPWHPTIPIVPILRVPARATQLAQKRAPKDVADQGRPQRRITAGPALGFAVRLLVTAIFFGLIFWKIDLRSVLARLQDLQVGPLALVGVLLGLQFLVYTWRWKKIVDNVSGKAVRFGDLCSFMGASQLYGQVLPSTVGGDLVRVAMLARLIGVSPATVSVLIDRITGLVVLVGLALVSLPFLIWQIHDPTAIASFAAVALGGSAVLAIFLLLPARLPPNWLPRTGAPWLSLASRSRKAMSSASLAPAVVGSGLFTQLCSIALVYLLGHAIGVALSPVYCVLLVPSALLITAIPISIAGWGVREGALAGCFALVGVPTPDIVAVSLLYGLTAPAIGLAYGIVALFSPAAVKPERLSRPDGNPADEA